MSSAWALIEDNGEVLFVRRSFDVGRGGQWCPPGGTIWQQEEPAVACVREAYEETGLRATVEQPLAVFQSAHYFLCSLNSSREALTLHEDECIDAEWVEPEQLLALGTIMDLKRMIPVLDISGLATPAVPEGLSPDVPRKVY